LQARIKELLNAGLIERSNSPFASPALLAKQKDGKDDRLVIDYRKLNSQTTRNATPIYRTSDIIQQCGKSKYYSVMDLAAGYHQIRMHPDSIDKTAFSTPDGLFHWTRMPQGITNGPGEFCRYVGGSFEDLNEKGAKTYFDDLIGHTLTWSQHVELLRLIFQRLRKTGLHVKASKTKIGFSEVKFLGHLICNGTVAPLKDRVDAVLAMPAPHNIATLRTFIGMIGYYRNQGLPRSRASPLSPHA
jgi:hypothetical protein